MSDIYQLMEGKDGRFDEVVAGALATDISVRLRRQLGEVNNGPRPTLRMSKLGPHCPRALWYSCKHPEMAEPLPPWAEVKFSFGHIIEAFAIALAKAAGHQVEGEQDELELDGIKGHRDCVIDGCIVDVKSLSSRGFLKLKHKTIATDDSFGYLDQLDGYTVASRDDPCVIVKDRAYLLGVDKQLGHMVLYEHRVREQAIRDRIKSHKRIVALSDPPPCECKTIKSGESGNLCLDPKASYNAFKYCCFPNIRTFLYAKGPQYLTRVVREPDVPEIDKFGNII